MRKNNRIYVSVLVLFLLLVCSFDTNAQTAKQDINRYEAERKKNEEITKMNALATDFINRKMEETFKPCSDGYRYALQPKSKQYSFLQFKNLGWGIYIIRVLQPTEQEMVNNSEVEWEGKVYAKSSTELKEVYYKEYDKEKGNWERPYQPFYSNFSDYPLASVIKRKGADFQFYSFKEVDCNLATASRETILNIIDLELAKANQNLVEANSIAETLRDRIFSKCSDGFWHFTFYDSRYGGLGAPLAQFRFKNLDVVLRRATEVQGGPNKFYVGFAADDVSIYYSQSFEDRTRQGNRTNAGWQQWEGKEVTIPYLTRYINTPQLSKKENKWWFESGSWSGDYQAKAYEIAEGISKVHSDIETAKSNGINPCVP